MGRALKTHIRNPRKRNESLCNRMSVKFEDDPKEASCQVCLSLAAEGRLEELSLPRKQKGANQSGDARYTPMQRSFAAHPHVTTNPKQAALDAGYSESYAQNHAYALRKQLAPLIMSMQEAAAKHAAISKSKVQSELAAMGFANIIDYFNVDPETGAMTPKQLNELTREQAAAIQEVKLCEFKGRMVIESLKLADKRANLVELGKTLGMFNKITIEDKREERVMLQDVPTEALEEAESLLLAAVSRARDQKSKNNAIDGEFEELPAPGAVEGDPID